MLFRDNIFSYQAVVVAQLAERPLPTSKDAGLNAGIGIFIVKLYLLSTVQK